jgi:hypothetical protein
LRNLCHFGWPAIAAQTPAFFMPVAGGRRAISGNIGNEKSGIFGFGWFMLECRKL